MKRFVVVIAGLLAGCAQMGTVQTDSNQTLRHEIDAEGKTNAVISEVRTTSTRSSGRALFSASSTFEGLDASQDGARQGLKVEKASQKSDVDRVVDLLGRVAPLAASMYGIPVSPAPAQPAPIQPAPAGMKWTIGAGGLPVLAPKDDPSVPRSE